MKEIFRNHGEEVRTENDSRYGDSTQTFVSKGRDGKLPHRTLRGVKFGRSHTPQGVGREKRPEGLIYIYGLVL